MQFIQIYLSTVIAQLHVAVSLHDNMCMPIIMPTCLFLFICHLYRHNHTTRHIYFYAEHTDYTFVSHSICMKNYTNYKLRKSVGLIKFIITAAVKTYVGLPLSLLHLCVCLMQMTAEIIINVV